MPETQTVLDRAGGAVQGKSAAASASPASSEGGRGTDANEAEKLRQQVASMEQERDRAKSAADKAAARAEKAEQRAQQLQDEFLSKVADAAVSRGIPDDGPRLEDLRRERDKLAQQLDEADGQTILDTIDRYSMDAADRKSRQRLAEMREEVQAQMTQSAEKVAALDAEIANLRRQQADLQPEFASRRERLQAIAEEEGLDLNDPKQREQVMLIDRREETLRQTLAPTRENPPGSSAATRVTESAQEAEVPKHVLEHWKGKGYSEAELAQLTAAWKTRKGKK